MPEKNELAWWHVPAKWGKIIYSGTIAILLGIIVMQQSWLNTCQEGRSEDKLHYDRNTEKWIDKLLDDKLHAVEQNKINPKIDEAVKSAVDSLKTTQP